MAVAAIKHMASNFAKLYKFKGVDFRRWQKKMHLLLSNISMVYVLTTPISEVGGDDATVKQIRKRTKWDNDDYVCRGLILKVLEQYNELLRIIGRFTQHKMNMDEAIQEDMAYLYLHSPKTMKETRSNTPYPREGNTPPGLSKSVDSDILLDIAGRTLLLGRAEFCLVTGFACGKVVFPKYLDEGIPPFVRHLFPDKLKKLEKNKAGLEEATKGKGAHPSDKCVKDSVTIGHLDELVPDKAAKGKAAQPSDKGDKVSVTIKDLGIIFQGQEEEFHNKVVNLIDKRKNNHIEFKKENPSKLPAYTIHGFAWELKANIYQDSNPTTKLQPTDAEMGHNWCKKSYDYLDDGRGATDGAKISGEAMNDADMSAVAHVE
uniref:Zinc finger, CCHC-type n=1 Tax=Tanacetum cinerariifolium TaxID=118510 RepID=A0A6L2LLU6_TANCI|nr:zinc finger, CCHC-type [Tanacetum cinerariifolium]